MAATLPATFIGMALVRVTGKTFDGRMVFVTPAHRPDVQSILMPASDIVETSLERTQMAAVMHATLCRIAECNSIDTAVALAEAALAGCEAVQAREIERAA